MNEDKVFIKAMFGQNAIHVPFHGVVQKMDNSGVVVCMFASKVSPDHPLMFGRNKMHSFVHGDMVIRPSAAFVSDHLIGTGLGGIVTSSSFCRVDEWAEKGEIVILGGERRSAKRSAETGS